MEFIAAVKAGYINCFNVRGRATPSAYWLFFLWLLTLLLVSLCLLTASYYVLMHSIALSNVLTDMAGGIICAAGVSIIPLFTALIRRLHDAGYSGFWVPAQFVLLILGVTLFGRFGAVGQSLGLLMVLSGSCMNIAVFIFSLLPSRNAE